MAWPIEEAKRISLVADRPILFETGYGPSGLPHIGTFTEVARTTWVRQSFANLTKLPTRLLTFSDDMDALRRVPENVPNKEMLEKHLGLPLTRIPDPFGTHTSFGHHNNAQLCEFLDRYGFEYEFASATDYYNNGRFNAALFRVAQCHAEIVDAIAPTLGKERAETYSPFMPIHPETGHVMQVKIDMIDLEHGSLHWQHDGKHFATSIYNGLCKLQWKADWAMRWYALGVDYEMSGKDLIDSVTLSSKICTILGGQPPINLTYELFLDETGKKISKSKGNGVSMEDWLRYGPAESLSHFVYANPQRAKKLYLGMISRATDEYIENRAKLASQTLVEQEENPAWYVHGQTLPEASVPVSFGLLVNLASVANAETPAVLWDYLLRYVPEESWDNPPEILKAMANNAIAFYQDFVKPKKVYREPTEIERRALSALAGALNEQPRDMTAGPLQTIVYAIGNRYFDPVKGWFDCLYQVLLGQNEGPRFGLFIEVYGIDNIVKLIQEKLS